jgi:hypothetical protein
VSVACKACGSERLQKLDGELTVSFGDLKQLRASPIYVCQSILVCLDCGFTELPPNELQSLKKALTEYARGSKAVD